MISNLLLLLNHNKHIAIGDLCKYFRNNIKHFKNGNFKNFVTSHEKDDQIRTLMPRNNGLKIGISWLTFAKKNVNKRNLSTKEISSIINSNDHTFINLQYGNHYQEINAIGKRLGKKIFEEKENENYLNIYGLAEKILKCDVVISIDNSTAHLSGFLNQLTFQVQF